MKKYKDIEVGDRFGLLTVISYYGKIKDSNNDNRKHWVCKCDCGQEKICNDSLLKNGSIKSCGCLKLSKSKLYKRNVSDFVQWCNNKGINLEKIWDYKNNTCEPNKFDCKNLEQDIYLICHVHGNYSKKLKRFFDNVGCPVCMKQNNIENILAIKYPKIQSIWSDKNNFTPYDITYGSSKKIWLKCSKNIHDDYQQYIENTIRGNYECPKCVKERRISKAQNFVNDYLK